MSKQIVIVTSEFGKQGGGLSNSASKLFKILTGLGFNVQVVISSQSDVNDNLLISDNQKIIHDTVKVTSGGHNKSLQRDLFFRGHIYNVLKILQDTKPDLIIAFGAGLNGLFASELSKKLCSKLVVMPRGSEVNLAISNSELFHYNLECLAQAIALVSVSSELMERTKEIYFSPSCNYKIIPNIIDFKSNNSFSKQNTSEIILGTGAKYLNEKKGIHNLIFALAILNKTSKRKYNLQLCGFIDDDLKKNYQELIRSLKLEQHVNFLGVLNRNEFLIEMQSWDIALQSSFCEGFSNSIGDAISIGKPFIISDTGFIAEQIRTQFPELVFSELTTEGIAKKIHDTFFNKDIVGLCKNAVNTFKGLVSKEVVYSAWKQFLDDVLSTTYIKTIDFNNRNIITLLLHEISDSEFSSVELPKDKFSGLCELVSKAGFKFCSAREYFNAVDKTKLIVCTFDDGYKSVLETALPILKKHSFSATVFVCTDHIGKSNDWNPKDKVKRFHLTLPELLILKNEGWEIGSHGTQHISFHRLDEKEILNSLEYSKSILTESFGNIVSFAYPYGDTSPFIESIVANHYSNVFTTTTGGTHILLDRQRIKRYSFDEIQTLFTI